MLESFPTHPWVQFLNPVMARSSYVASVLLGTASCRPEQGLFEIMQHEAHRRFVWGYAGVGTPPRVGG
jgi:hypothetical protein